MARKIFLNFGIFSANLEPNLVQRAAALWPSFVAIATASTNN